jgi:hypothetical protein
LETAKKVYFQMVRLVVVVYKRDQRLPNWWRLESKSCFKVTGHPFWHFAENRYCALKISPIFIKFSPNVRQCMQNMVKL